MKKVLFFTQNRWAFGSIHHALCKELYKYDIYANLLDWTVGYTLREFSLLIDKYDYFVTNPEAVMALHNEYKVPLEKIISVAHGQWDILLARQNFGLDILSKINKYAVVSNILKEKSIEFGSPVVPEVVNLGIHFDLLYNPPSTSLKTIGYAGAYETVNFFGQEIKRGRLVKDIADKTNLNLNNHEFFNYMCVPSYYKEIDCLIMSSTEESVGLPMLEGAAAGKLCIGTPVGYFAENSAKGGGIMFDTDEEIFVNKSVEMLEYYKANPDEYRKKCLDIQEYARYNYDWSKVIDQWVKLF